MGGWATGLFGCFSNCGLCIKSYLLPCLVYGQVARAVGKSCCLHALFFFIPVFNFIVMARTRGTLREKREIPGGFLGDLLVNIFCMGCAISQEASEVRVMVRERIQKAKEGQNNSDTPANPEDPAADVELEAEETPDTEQPKETDPVDIERE